MVAAWLNALAFIVASPDSVAVPSAAPPPTPDAAVRITLSSDGYYDRGDRAKVRVRLADDGYLLVLRADVDGRVRVLFPLDPGDDDFVRGDKDYELRGRGDRETFYVDDRDGTGTVLAARSASPFRYDRFVRGDHWDYRVLANERIRDDAEAGLLDLVTEMADSAHFDYDVVTYTVGSDGRRPYAGYYGSPCYGCGGYDGYGGLSVRFIFGRSYRYCDPFLYDPFYCNSFYYDPFYYGYYRGYYGRFGHSCFGDPFCYGYRRPIYTNGRSAGGFIFKRPVPPPPFVLPRDRTPGRNSGVSTRPPDGGFDGRRDPPIEPRRRPSADGNGNGSDRRRDPPSAEPGSRGGDWSSRPRSNDGGGRSVTPSRGSSSRGSSSRGSSSRGSGSRPSNSGGGRRH